MDLIDLVTFRSGDFKLNFFIFPSSPDERLLWQRQKLAVQQLRRAFGCRSRQQSQSVER